VKTRTYPWITSCPSPLESLCYFLALSLLVLLVLLCPFSATLAATYYVDASNGSDNNNGLAQAAAWRTIAKFNATIFQPGDQILFKRGSQWREQLVVPSSGTEANPITIADYGEGAKPILIGSEEVVGLITDWKNEGNNVWSKELNQECKTIVFNSTSDGITKLNPYSQYDWYWNNNSLYVYATSNPAGFYSSIEASKRDNCINANGKNYLNFSNFELRTGNKTLFMVSGNFCAISNVDCLRNAVSGIYVLGMYNSIHGCNVSYTCINSSQAITVQGNNNKVFNNIVHNNFNEGIDVYMGSSECEVYNNTVYENSATGIYIDASTKVKVFGNRVYNNSGWGIGISNEGSHGTSNVSIYYNICSLNIDGIHFWDAGGSNYAIYNNIIYGFTEHGIRIRGTGTTSYSNFNINNNIVYKNNNYEWSTALMVQDGTGMSIDYNCYFQTNPSHKLIHYQDTYYTTAEFSVYKTFTLHDSHTIILNPSLTDPAQNVFSLRSDSPCIDAGIFVGLLSDFLGSNTPQGKSVDIGAIEYKSLAPPKNLRMITN